MDVFWRNPGIFLRHFFRASKCHEGVLHAPVPPLPPRWLETVNLPLHEAEEKMVKLVEVKV